MDGGIALGGGTQPVDTLVLQSSSRAASSFLPSDGASSPLIPTRGFLDSIRRPMTGDSYIGRGCEQRVLAKSELHNPYKVSEHGRDLAIQLFEQHVDPSRELQEPIPPPSGVRLVCHCKQHEGCHADVLIKKFKDFFPEAHDRSKLDQRPPTASEVNLLAKHREDLSVMTVRQQTKELRPKAPGGKAQESP